MSAAQEPKYSVGDEVTPDVEPSIGETQTQTRTTVKAENQTGLDSNPDRDVAVENKIEVRQHAVFRYLSRVDAMETYPKSQIRQLFQSAQPVPLGPDGTRWDEETGLVFIRTENGAIQTCYYRSRSQVGL